MWRPCVCVRAGASIAGKLTMEWLNDANAIFEYKGIYHIMMQVRPYSVYENVAAATEYFN